MPLQSKRLCAITALRTATVSATLQQHLVQIRRVEPEREEQNIGCSGSKTVSEGLDGANERILADGVE